MPGFYKDGEYDLSGFAVGVVEKKRAIDGSRIKPGDVLIGLTSSGLHSNGYSLARKVLFGHKKIPVGKVLPDLGIPVGEELLKPTRIYVKAVKALMAKVDVKGMAHITGGGIPGNLPRIFPKGVGARIFRDSWPEQPIFGLIKKYGNVPPDDMRRTFNMGIGFIIAVDRGEMRKAMHILKRNGFPAYVIGEVQKGIRGVVYAGA